MPKIETAPKVCLEILNFDFLFLFGTYGPFAFSHPSSTHTVSASSPPFETPFS